MEISLLKSETYLALKSPLDSQEGVSESLQQYVLAIVALEAHLVGQLESSYEGC